MAADRPLTTEEVKRVKPEPASEPPPDREHTIATTFATSAKGDPPPLVGSRITRVASGRGTTTWQIDLTTNLTGGPAFAPKCELIPVEKPSRPARNREIDGYRPPWVEMRPEPQVVPQPRANKVFRGDQELEPLTINPPDGRFAYFDTSYPWVCVCRVSTPIGVGSGVLIGRRLVLTASHGIDWSNPGGTVAAHYFNGGAEGMATLTGLYWWTKVSKVTTSTVDEDYVVGVLSEPLGGKLGYMGYRTYDSSWDGKPWWKTIGYPLDVASGLSPVVEHGFKLDEDDFDFGPARAMSTPDGDLMPGQSGSPAFTWFKNNKWPKVVGVVSGIEKGNGTNYFAGGSWLTDLIAYARKHSP
jgi:V8-like Glu-specific endopeptidase